LKEPAYINTSNTIGLTCKTAGLQDRKTDLRDVTFLLPLRIDSRERKENADALIRFTFRHFKTSFIALEADATRKYSPEYEPEGFHYTFIEDPDEIFRKTKWINRLISMDDTPFIAVWDDDAIVSPEQIILTAERLQTEQVVMSLPYDGRFYSYDKVSCDLFKRIPDIEILLKRIAIIHLILGYHYTGGAFIIHNEE